MEIGDRRAVDVQSHAGPRPPANGKHTPMDRLFEGGRNVGRCKRRLALALRQPPPVHHGTPHLRLWRAKEGQEGAPAPWRHGRNRIRWYFAIEAAQRATHGHAPDIAWVGRVAGEVEDVC